MLTHHLLQTGTIQCKFSFTKNNFSSPNSTFFFCSEEDIPSKARLLLDELYEKSTKDHYPEGCFVGIIQDADLKTLKSSLLSIIQSFGTPLPWGRESSFLAKRFFVTVPGGLAMSMEEKLRIHPESSESDVNAAFRAITDSNFLQTVENIIAHLQRVKSSLKPIVQLQQLLAIQVNLHNGTTYLPYHSDDINTDGFGVVICTVTIWDSATIIVGDEPANDSCMESSNIRTVYSFEQKEGNFYVLSNQSRNSCCHGVLCPFDTTTSYAPCTRPFGRVTVNFRFGRPGNRKLIIAYVREL